MKPEKSLLREHGWHVDVTEKQVKNTIRALEALFNRRWMSLDDVVTYKVEVSDSRWEHDKKRVFYHDGTECACFDMWGNLVIYNETLEVA
jgi:hypothetical protein